MIAIAIDLLGGYCSAKFIRNIWFSLLCAFFVGVVAAVLGGLLVYALASDVFTVGEIGARIIAGIIWHPIVAIITTLVFRRWTQKPALNNNVEGDGNHT